MLSFLAVGIQLTSAKFAAEYHVDNDTSSIGIFNTWISKKVLQIGLILGIAIILCSTFLQSFLQFNSWIPFVIIGLGIPLYFNLSVKRGIAQGTDRFRTLAGTYLAEMLLRFVGTFLALIMALWYADWLTTEAVSVGFLLSFLAALTIRKQEQNENVIFEDVERVKSFVWIILIYEFSQILINNSDVILTKHFFNAVDAGLYGAIALIGRVVFFGTWTIVTLLFPKVIQREKQGLPHFSLFWLSFGLTAGFGCAVVAACLIMPEFIITVLFGKAFLSVAPLLWKYAVATTLFAGANVFAYYYMSLSKYIPVVLSVIAGILQVVIIFFYHDSLEQVIHVQIAIMLVLLLTMIIYQLSTLWSNNLIKS